MDLLDDERLFYSTLSALQKLEAQLADVQNVYIGGVRHSTVKNAFQRLQEKAKDTSGGYRNIFQSACTHLEDHVSDVQSGQGHTYRIGSLQRHHRPASTKPMSGSSVVVPLPIRSQPDQHCYPDNLLSSLQVFQIPKWRPLTAHHKPSSSATRGAVHERPRSSPPTNRPVAPHKTCPEPQKKHSQPESLWYPPWVTRPTDTLKEDTISDESLSPHTFSLFVNTHRPLVPTLTYGDISKQTATKGTLTEEFIEGTTESSEIVSSSSGIDSDGGTTGAEIPSTDDLDTESASETNKTNGPLADLMLQLAILNLRPEKPDPIESRQEIKSYDFSVGDFENTVYPFQCPVPVPLDSIDLHLHAKENSDWRIGLFDSGTVDPVVSAMCDRLVEMERLQLETQELEEKRVRLMRKRPVSRCNKLRERRGCNVCLQPGCAGNCSSNRQDSTNCEKCRQALCNGVCRNNKCDLRLRQCGDDRRATLNSSSYPPHPCCKSGDRQTQTGKSSQRIFLARPKTAVGVIGRGRSISETRGLRPVSASTSGYLSKEAEKLGLEPPRPKLHGNNRLIVPRKDNERVTGRSNNPWAETSANRRSSSRTKQQAQRPPDQV